MVQTMVCQTWPHRGKPLRIGLTTISMKILSVDQDSSLYQVSEVMSTGLVDAILHTEWQHLAKIKQAGQENWSRSLIVESDLPWIDQWHASMCAMWPELEQTLQTKLQPYSGTAFWMDPAGFVCPIHTDGEMPGSMQLNWIGHADLGTTFYYYRNPDSVRFKSIFAPNHGYVMINQQDQQGYRPLQWHGMLVPVPMDTFRITSYTWLIPVK